MESQVISILLLISMLISFAQCGCQDEDCSCRKYGVAVRSFECNCSSPDFACAVKYLPDDVTSLNFTTIEDKKQSIHLNSAMLGEFIHLTHLSIATPMPEREVEFTYLYGLDQSDTFQGLPNLKTLRISMLISRRTSALHNQLFAPLVSLEELDLSYTQMLSFSQLREAFFRMKTESLTKLRLRNVQSHTNNPNFRMDINLTWFLEPLESMPLEILDFSRNALLRVTPGLLQHKHLREVYFHENFLRFTSFFTECFLHPTLEVVVGDYQGCQTNNGYKRVSYNDWMEHLGNVNETSLLAKPPATQDSNTQRDSPARQTSVTAQRTAEPSNLPTKGIGYWTCQAFSTRNSFPFFENFDCRNFPDYELQIAEHPCIGGVLLPIGPNLREINLAHFNFFQGGFGPPLNGSWCFNPENNLRLANFSNLEKWGKIFSKILNDVLFKGLKKLEILTFENSDINITNTDFFSDCSSLKILNLRGNKMHLRDDTGGRYFANNTQLRELILSNCGLSAIHTGAFAHLDKLQTLDLSDNRLKKTLSFKLSKSGQMRRISLQKNEIQTLLPQMRKQLDDIARNSAIDVDLSYNPLSCACADTDFIDWMQTTNVRFVGSESYQCHGTNSGIGLIMNIDLQEIDSVCNPSYVLVVCASVFSTLGVVAVLLTALTVYRRRYSIMRWKYTRFTRPKLTFDANVTFQYDAFIVYNSDDKWWTHHALLAEMEDRRHLKLCIYLRDFPAGGAYADVIDDAIEHSRKTVLILSPNFFKSHWCQHEMSMVHNKLVAEGVDLLELVILSSLSSSDMTCTLTQLMQKKTILNWTEDSDGQKLFWDKLEDAIRSPRVLPNLS